MRPSRGVTVALAAIVVAGSLSGCFPVLHELQRAADPEDMAAPTSTPKPLPASTIRPTSPDVTIQAGSQIASATIRSATGAVSGDITVVANDTGGYDILFANYRAPSHKHYSVSLIAHPTAANLTCDRSPGVTWGLEGLGIDRTQKIVLAKSRDLFHRGDPSFFDAVELVDTFVNKPGCAVVVAGVAPLKWTIPDMNPGLFVSDSGPTGGALGTLKREDGRPLSYVVVRNDLLPEIAARFGITVDDLLWLNPARQNFDGDAQIGEVLNLSRSGR